MGSVTKRGKNYHARVRIVHNYKTYSDYKTFPTKLEALKWIEIREEQIRAGIYKNIDTTKTLREAIERYRDIITPEKKGARWETLRLNAMLRDPHLPLDRRLESITTDELAQWRRLLNVTSASKNRVTTILRAVFETARLEWKWISTNPLDDLRRLPEPPPRERRISDHEISLICSELNFDPDNPDVSTQKQKVGLIFLFALETAMRQSEITTLTWQQVNLRGKYLTLIETKNGYRRHVPLSSRAIRLLKIMGPQRQGDVFGITANTVSTLFRRCVRKCHIENLRFHDTRHEACTRLAQLIPVLDLAKMLGHRNIRSLMIYYDPTPTEIANKLG